MASRSSEGAHVLAVPFAALVGHMTPLMSLCEQLAAAGVAVTFAYSQSYYERSQAYLQMQGKAPHGAAEGSIALSGSDNIRVVGVPDGLPYHEYLSPDAPRLQAQATIDMEDNLVALARSIHHPFPISCIVADGLVSCASSVAKRLGIPHVAFWTQSAATFAAHVVATQSYSVLKEHAAPAANGNGASSLITCIPGCPPFTFKELPTFLQACDPTDFFFSFLTTCFKNMEDCARIVLNTFCELEYESLEFINKRQNMFAVGPLLPTDYLRAQQQLNSGEFMRRASRKLGITARRVSAKEDDECLAWLDMQKPRSVLFVSFGSLVSICEDQIAELATGLEASGYPFLMVVRDAMMEGQAPRFPMGFQERLTRNGRALFVSWASQLEVLAHPSVGGFFTHCGWNSTLEGIYKGIPFICLPLFVDQMLNCRCITDAWGIGVDLEDKGNSSSALSANVSMVNRQLIEEKVRLLMDPSSSAVMRKRANELAMQASKAVLQADGSSQLNLKSFISWLHNVA